MVERNGEHTHRGRWRDVGREGQGGAEGFDPNAFQGGDAGQSQKADDGVVDAEFTEVKDDKK